MKVLRSKEIGRIAKRCVIALILAVNLLVVAGGLNVLAEMVSVNQVVNETEGQSHTDADISTDFLTEDIVTDNNLTDEEVFESGQSSTIETAYDNIARDMNQIPDKMELELDENGSLGVAQTHATGYWNDVAGESSDESIAIVKIPNEDGYCPLVEPVSAGTCMIRIYLVSNPDIEATCEVKVYGEVEEVTLDHEVVELREMEMLALKATVAPATAKQEVTWLSSNNQVATVDENGIVTAVGTGVCHVFAFSGNRKQSAVCTINVINETIAPEIRDGYIIKPTYDGDMLWSIDASGCLEVSGYGDTLEYLPAWVKYNNCIRSAKLTAGGMSSTANWFWDCYNLTYVDVDGLDTSNVTDLSCMFYGCESITQLDLSSLDTRKVREADLIFGQCSGLQRLNLSGWTFNWDVFDASMFRSCYCLCDLILCNTKMGYLSDYDDASWSFLHFFNTDIEGQYSPVKNIDLSAAEFERWQSFDFADDIWIQAINISNVKATSLRSMEEMFRNCSSLESVDLTGLSAPNVTDIQGLFHGCSSLMALDLSGFNTSNVKDMSGVFYGCKNLKNLNLSKFDTAKVTDMSYMFYNCSNLQEISLDNFVTAKVDRMEEMFSGCSSLRQLDLTGFVIHSSDSYNGLGLYSCLEGCTNLEIIMLPPCPYTLHNYGNSDKYDATYDDWVFKLPESYGYYWKNDDGYKCVCAGNGGTFVKVKCRPEEMVMYGSTNGLSNWTVDASGVMEMNGDGKYNVLGSFISNLSYLTATNFVSQYYHGQYDKSEDIKKAILNLSGLNSMKGLFSNLHNLKDVDFGNTSTSEVTDMSFMFFDCSSLQQIDISPLDTHNVVTMEGMFSGCSSLADLKLGKVNTSSVTDMSRMFENCSSLKTVDISGFKSDNVTNMQRMFYGCTALRSIELSNIDTSKVADMSWMFWNCSSLDSIDISGFQTRNVTNMSAMFSCCASLRELNLSKLDLRNLTVDTSLYSTYINMFSPSEIEKVIMPDLLPSNTNLIYLPQKEEYWKSEYCWKKEKSGQVAESLGGILLRDGVEYTYKDYYIDEGGTYIRVKGSLSDAESGDLDGDIAGTKENVHPSSSPKGTILSASSVTAKNGSIPKDATFTVTSTDSENPTVSFDGVKSTTAKAVTIPKTILYNGVEYSVTTVSPKTFQNKKENAKYKVIDNRIGHLEIAYTGSTDQTKKSVSVPQYSTYKGIKFKVTNVSSKAFKNNTKVTTVKLATSITDIGVSAFEGCSKLKTVTIGKSAKTIGKNAFKNCKNLKTVTIKSSKLTKVGKSAFKGINDKCKIKVPSKKLKAYKALFKKAGLAKSVKVTK